MNRETEKLLADAASRSLQNVAAQRPLVHTITNFVTVNDCANIILAAGGTPTMARDIREVEEVAANADALVLNLGAIDSLESMLAAGIQANLCGVPVVLDPVAAGASALRKKASARLLERVRFAVVRGNASEIKALAVGVSDTRGVDAGDGDVVTEESLAQAVEMAMALGRRLQCVVVISGAIDIVCDGDRNQTALLRNGCSDMGRITGSGCMLTALTGAFCGANREKAFEAALAAAGMLGLAGELALERTKRLGGGTATFRTCLIDAVSLMTPEQLKGGLKLESI